MAYRGENDFSTGPISENYSETIQLTGQEQAIDLPDGSFVRDADMIRDGFDLILNSPHGSVTVEGYFAQDTAPDLVSPDGSTLTPELVNAFSHSPAQYAQAMSISDVSPVGAVEEFSGEATVTRTDGSIHTVSIGTEIYEGDIIETGSDGAVNILFSDETTFAVSEDARMAIDEYVFDPTTEAGSQNFSVLKGVFVFTSGLIGRDDPDDVQIDTPVGSIGIRGTIIAGDVDTGEITVVEGAIVLRDFNGNELTLADQFETGKFDQSGTNIHRLGQLSAEDVGTKFASVSNVSPQLFSSINDAANEQNSEDDSVETQTKQKAETVETQETQDDQNNAEGTVDQNNDGEVDGTVQDTPKEAKDSAESETKNNAEGTTDQNGDNQVDGTVDQAPEQQVKGEATLEQQLKQIQNTQEALAEGKIGENLTNVQQERLKAYIDAKEAKLQAQAETTTETTDKTTISTTDSTTVEYVSTDPVAWKTRVDLAPLHITNGPNHGFITNGNQVKFNVATLFNDPNGDIIKFVIKGINVDGTVENVPWITLQPNGLLVANIPNNLDSSVLGEHYNILVEAQDATGGVARSVVHLQTNIADILGDATTNVLNTVAAEDLVLAMDGDDTVNINHNNTQVFGDGGNDTFVIQNNQTGGHIFKGGTGIDTVDYSSLTNNLTIQVKALYTGVHDGINNADLLYNIENLNLGSGNDTVSFFNGSPLINAINANAGNDTFHLNGAENINVIDGGAGTDLIDFSADTEGRTVDLNAGTVTGSNAGNTTTIANIENVTGSSGNDAITGNANNNVIHGGMGDDTIDGGDGVDQLYGDDGNDTFVLNETDFSTSYADLDDNTTAGTFNGGDETANGYGDTLQFMASGGVSLDFTTMMASNTGVFSDIETIRLDNTNANIITLDFDTVIAMTNSNNTLIIDLNDGGDNTTILFDKLTHTGDAVADGTEMIDGETYNRYTFTDGSDTVTLLVDQDYAGSDPTVIN